MIVIRAFERVVPMIAVASVWVLAARAAGAQPTRKVEGEVSGNFYFGNTRQVLASTRAQYERADSGFAFRTVARFGYGQTTTDDAGTFVSKRSWSGATNYDFRPFADISPYLRATVEGSLENRIARRYSAGAGARYNIVRKPGTDVVLSLGTAGERTTPLAPADTAGTIMLARGSTSLRVRRDISSRLTIETENTYEPALHPHNDYTITSANTAKVRLARFAALTVTFRNHYDNRARARGARVNNEGELLIGLLTSF